MAGQERPPQGGAPGATTQEGRRGRRPQAPATPTPAPEAQPVESWSINAAPTPTTPQQPREAAPAGANEPEAAPVTGGLGTADLRARWPEVLDAVRSRRRVTWIILRENAQVHTFADGVLTLDEADDLRELATIHGLVASDVAATHQAFVLALALI